MSECDITEGVEGFDNEESAYCEMVTLAAKAVSLKYQGHAAVHKIADVAAMVMAGKKDNPSVVTERVYFFCMSWLAGAMSVAESGHYVKRVTMVHCAIAFLAGAATITVFSWC